MAFVYEKGSVPLSYDRGVSTSGTPAFSSSAVIDASGEKIAFIGSVWHPTVRTGTINIRKVHFRCGAVTLNAASEVRVSLQNVSATAGPPYQPDETQDQFYDFKTATTSLSANAWNSTGNLSADRAVDLSADSIGDANSRWLAVVIEFQVFNASDSVVASVAVDSATIYAGLSGALCLKTGGTFAIVASRYGIVALECDDGTFAFLQNSVPASNYSSASVASNGAIRRAGVKFQVPSRRQIDRAGLFVFPPNGSDGAIVLYDSDGSTVLASVDIDNDAVYSASAFGMEVCFSPVTLEANTNYYLAFVASTTTAASVYYLDVNAAALMDGFILGQSAYWSQHNGTSWSDTTTRRPHFALGFCSWDTGTSAAKVIGG